MCAVIYGGCPDKKPRLISGERKKRPNTSLCLPTLTPQIEFLCDDESLVGGGVTFRVRIISS